MRSKKIVGVIILVLLIVVALGTVGVLSKGFQNWDTSSWLEPKYVLNAKDYECYGDDNSCVGSYFGSDKYIELPKTAETYGDLHTVAFEAFLDKVDLVGVKIPDGFNLIKAKAFKGCTGLRKVVVPASVTTIEANAFEGCGNVVVYCVADTKPVGFAEGWDTGVSKVVYGYNG